MIFDIIKGTNAGRSKVISCTDLVNFYPEIEDGEKSKNVKALIGCPGYRFVVEAYTGGYCRGLYPTSTGRMFAIVYDKFIEITTSEVALERGTLNTVAGQCGMVDNGTQLLIVDGSNGYVYTLATDDFVSITDADFPGYPTHCIFTDGYFLVNCTGNGQFYFSASYNGLTWDALDFATAEYSADTLQGLSKTSNGTIWMLGKHSLELWQNVGTSDLPWRRISGCVKEVGCISPYSIASNGDQVFWLGNGLNGYGSVYMGSGYEVKKISTHAIEYQIKQFVGLENVSAFVYSDEGHSFYVINFDTQKTFVYDLSTGEWHRRGTIDTLSGNNVRQFLNSCAFFNGKIYCGSFLNGNIYEMSLDILSEAGSSIKREIITNHIGMENRLIRHKKIEIDLEKGVGLEGEDEPKIMLQFSDNGGNTWSNQFDIVFAPGKIGEYYTRAIYKRLGVSRDRIYKIVVSDSVKWVITNAFIEVE